MDSAATPMRAGEPAVRADALSKAQGVERYAADRPVKMHWEREENLLAGYRRHACHIDYKLGADRHGNLQAVQCRLVYDTGAYAHLGAERCSTPQVTETKCATRPLISDLRASADYRRAMAAQLLADFLVHALGTSPALSASPA